MEDITKQRLTEMSILRLAGGNPGSLTVLSEIYQQEHLLKEMNITMDDVFGELFRTNLRPDQIWDLGQYVCNKVNIQDVGKVILNLKHGILHQEELVNQIQKRQPFEETALKSVEKIQEEIQRRAERKTTSEFTPGKTMRGFMANSIRPDIDYMRKNIANKTNQPDQIWQKNPEDLTWDQQEIVEKVKELTDISNSFSEYIAQAKETQKQQAQLFKETFDKMFTEQEEVGADLSSQEYEGNEDPGDGFGEIGDDD